jgi:hypothetical protein
MASSRTAAQRKPPPAAVLPHSWMFSTWPPGVAPGDEARAKYLFRVFKRELIAAGAVSRVGRQIIFLGHGYARFLATQISRVDNFEIEMVRVNRSRRTRRDARRAAVVAAAG